MDSAACDEERAPELDQLELIQRLGRIGYWEYDPKTHALSLPPHSLELLSSLTGSSRENPPRLREVMASAERRRLLAALDQAVRSGLALHLELRLVSHRGQKATVVIKGVPIERKGERRFAGTFHDITREKQIEAEREEVLSQLHALIDGLPVGVTVFDEDLRLLFWNDHIYDILGLPQGAVYKYVRFEELIRYPAERGEYGPGDPQTLVAERAALARRFEPHRFERAARDGRTLFVDGYPFRFGGRISGFVTTYTDITEQKRSAEQIAHQHQVLKTIIDNFPGGISLFDGSLRLVAANAPFQSLLDFPDSLMARDNLRFEDFVRFNIARGDYGPGDPQEQLAVSMARARTPQLHKIERTRPNGRTLEIIGAPIPDGGFVSIYIDVTERKYNEAKIRNMALLDALTALPNRLSLNEQIEQALRPGENGRAETFALLFLDLDGFKRVNDSLGHDAGDALLIQVAARLREAVRETDTVARLGGDEFVLLLRDSNGDASTARIAEMIIARIAEPFVVGSDTVHIGTSIGIAVHPRHGTRREALLKAADEAMYRAKAAGRGTWRISSVMADGNAGPAEDAARAESRSGVGAPG
ncbi:MAG: PAS-domain containing protein [Azospira sp.]|jgi:diguanylate cyclase (GGDEF)-like protein|nr:PAS-domain containing protein [Azospira sp.]